MTWDCAVIRSCQALIQKIDRIPQQKTGLPGIELVDAEILLAPVQHVEPAIRQMIQRNPGYIFQTLKERMIFL